MEEEHLTPDELQARYDEAVDWIAKIIEGETVRRSASDDPTPTWTENAASIAHIMALLEEAGDTRPSAVALVHDVLTHLVARGHPAVVRQH